MTRRAILLAQFTIPDPSLSQADDFRRLWNDFASAANLLIQKHSSGLWDVKLARKVEKLFDRLRNHPAWRVR